jgi:hypothetical protein
VESPGAQQQSLRALMSDAPSESEAHCRYAQGKSSTSSLATTLEMLASEVTPRLLAGAEPDAHHLMSRFVLKGDQMEVKTQRNIILTQGLSLV